MKQQWYKISLAAACGLMAFSASAAEVTLKAVSAFPQGMYFNDRYEKFVEKVNAEGKGLIQIQKVGGPESMPPFQIGNALRNGVVDIANSTGVYHANLVPEALAMVFSSKPMSELRENGGYDLLNQIHKDKAGIVWLGRLHQGLQYHIYTNKEVKDGSVKGMKLRSVPIYRSFFMDLGAEPFQVPPGEVYTALERGQVDGYGWPSVAVFEMGWQDQTKYRVDPGFYNVEVSLFMSERTLNKLNDEQRAFLEKQVRELEDTSFEYDKDGAQKETQRLLDNGMEIITLPEEQAKEFVQKANESGWKSIEQTSPNHAAQLRKAFE